MRIEKLEGSQYEDSYKIYDFDPNGKMFDFYFTKDTCHEINTGICALEYYKNDLEVDFYEYCKRDKIERCVRTYLALKNKIQIGGYPTLYKFICGHFGFVDGQHRMCVALKKELVLDIIFHANTVDEFCGACLGNEKILLAEIKVDFKLISDKFLYCKSIVDIMIEHKEEDGICYISQKEIADRLNKSQSGVGKTIKQLERIDNCIQIVGPGKYIVNNPDILNTGPFKRFLELQVAILVEPEIVKLPYKEQVEKLGFKSVKELQVAYGYFFTTFKSS